MVGLHASTFGERIAMRRATARAQVRELPHPQLFDAARIDVNASRAAGEPRRSAVRIRTRHWASGAEAAPATILALHETRPHLICTGDRNLSVLAIYPAHAGSPRVERPAANRPLAQSDAGLAALRAAVFDLHAVVRAQPQRPAERLILIASGIAAAASLVALGAGVSLSAITDDPLRDELLLDLLQGELLHERMVDDVASRFAAAVLVDPSGARDDWRDAALARVTTPIALLEQQGTAMARIGYPALRSSHRLHATNASKGAIANLLAALAEQDAAAVFANVAAQPAAVGLNNARHALGEPCGTELD